MSRYAGGPCAMWDMHAGHHLARSMPPRSEIILQLLFQEPMRERGKMWGNIV